MSNEDDVAWSVALANEYSWDELNAMNTWLDVNLALNQAKIEATTTRLAIVFTVLGLAVSVLATSSDASGAPFTVIALIIVVGAAIEGAWGLRSEWVTDRDPTTTWDSMWGPRVSEEVAVLLYRRRSRMFDDQIRVLHRRAAALRNSSWAAGVAIAFTAAAVLASRLV